MRRMLLAFAVAAALASRAGAATAPSVTATASKTDVSVGEPFAVEVRASGPPGAVFAFPPAVSLETIELASAPPPTTGKGPAAPPQSPGTFGYRAQVFAVGDAQVPPIPVRYRLVDGSTGEVRTAAIPLHVVSLLPKDKEEQKLTDVRPPLGLSIGRAFWIGLAIVALLAAALVTWLVRRRRAALPIAAAAVPALEPDVEAKRALEALIGSGKLARGELRPFYIELTLVAKRYLERRLEAPIVEMTSAEMLAHLRENAHAVDLAPLLRDLSGAADRIKFAKGQGVIEVAERHLAETRAMIDNLEARLRPVAEAAATNGATPASDDTRAA